MAKSHEFPEEGDLVICTVKNVRNFGAFVLLEEYDSKEGFIHVAEIATGWVKRMSDFVREGQRIVCRVLGVDSQKGHIDLSLKKVNDHQKREKIQEWKNEQRAHKLLEIVAERLKKDMEWCYENFANSLIDYYGSLYVAFEEAANPNVEPDKSVFKGKWVKDFTEVAKENVTPALVSIDGYMELTSNAPDGIEHIKQALLKAQDKQMNVEIQYIGAPRYRIILKAQDYKTAEEELKTAVTKTSKSIEKNKGHFKFTRRER